MSALLEKLKRLNKRARHHFSRRALIVLYHRIADEGSDPWRLAVSPKNFEEHLQVLKQHCEVIPLQDLAISLSKFKLFRHRIVVTFDDGYADNLLVAKPLLEKYDVPATVFITTGYIDGGREFWWDELERLLIRPGVLPSVLDLTVNKTHTRWELGDAACYDEISFRRNQDWRAWQEEEPTARHSVYRSLWQAMNLMNEEDRLRLRGSLLEWAGATGTPRDSHRPMNAEEIVELVREGLIEVGSHTVTHAQLSALDKAFQAHELRRSKTHLEEIIGSPVTALAYPYGREFDYTTETLSLVKETGFTYGCTTSAGLVEPPLDDFRLPRVQINDMDGESFARFISDWLDPD